MTRTPLDHPVWNSLTSRHQEFALGASLARRYAKDVNVFAAARDDSEEALQALSELIRAGDSVLLLQRGITLPPGLDVTKRATGIQMLYDGEPADMAPDTKAKSEAIIPLGDRDAPDMLALAKLTEPGPFTARTHRMGQFLGVRSNGRLAAMAGTRLSFLGYREVSGVCVHPECRGQGLARRLSIAVSRRIIAEGDVPFLHAWAANVAAIALYESIGFSHHGEVDVAMLEQRCAG